MSISISGSAVYIFQLNPRCIMRYSCELFYFDKQISNCIAEAKLPKKYYYINNLMKVRSEDAA